jgi:LDH2 family malate/lactate/ureidoglycolate dehydrogenase
MHSILRSSLRRTLVSTSQSRRSFSSDYVTVSIEEARSTTMKALQRIGWDEEDASLQAEIMTAAQLCGNNQGLVKMYQPEMMAPSAEAGKPFLEREMRSSAVINANQAPGMLAAVTGADKAVDLLEKDDHNSIAIVCTHNTVRCSLFLDISIYCLVAFSHAHCSLTL